MKNNKIAILFEKKLRFFGRGKIEGELYDLGDYPGLVEKQGKHVYGEVYEILDETVIEELDVYEEYDVADSRNSLFIRRISTVTLENGTLLPAIAYFYNKSTKNAHLIETGHWNKKES